jgi:acetylornithine/N-succinyldiaminopimelate aminotransferase
MSNNIFTSDKLLPVHKRFDLVFKKGKGVYLYTDKAKYLDFGAGIAVNALGHCHKKMVKAITKQAKKLWHVSNIYNTSELNNYAEKLVKASDFADYAFFCNSGAESIECAIKMIRRHFYVKNQSQKNRIITFSGAFHGRTMATISAAAKPKYLEGFEPKLEGFDNVEFGNIEAVKKAINSSTAGILIEPIQGEEGIRVSDKNFIKNLRKLCDENDLLLAFDEVQCGMGRTGKLFAHQFYETKPDIVSTAKAIAGGFPLGACLATKNSASGMIYGVHGTTYGGNPLAMAVANAVLEEMLKENFLKNVQEIGSFFKNELMKIQQKFPDLIDEIRGEGLMLGIKINTKIENGIVVKKFIDNHLLTIPAGENVIRILPPLIITKKHVIEAIEKINKSFNELKLQS